jgi:hypothetical protein
MVLKPYLRKPNLKKDLRDRRNLRLLLISAEIVFGEISIEGLPESGRPFAALKPGGFLRNEYLSCDSLPR